MPVGKLVDIFQKEALRFEALTLKKCKKLTPKLFNALNLIGSDMTELGEPLDPAGHSEIRNTWVEAIKRDISKLSRRKRANDKYGEGSVVADLLSTIPTPSPKKPGLHPRGDKQATKTSTKAKKSVSFDVDDSSSDNGSDEYSVSSTEDEDEAAPLKKRKDTEAHEPLVVTPNVKDNIRALKSCEHIKDMNPRVADWLADTFVQGSSHVRQVVEDRHRDINWSRSELAKICERVIHLYDKVELREKMGDQISKNAKKALLDSECITFAQIRTSLHVIRLGEARAASYRQKVEDENARADFERVSGSSRSYKNFSKELASSQKEKPRTNSRGGRSNMRPRRPFDRPYHRNNRPRGRGGRGQASRFVHIRLHARGQAPLARREKLNINTHTSAHRYPHSQHPRARGRGGSGFSAPPKPPARAVKPEPSKQRV